MSQIKVEPVEDDVPEPIWTGGTLCVAQLDAVIKLPLTRPDLFDRELLPIRRLVAVWAPAGSGKRTALEEYCIEELSLGHRTVAADAHRECGLEVAIRAIWHEGPQHMLRVIIVQHADDMVTNRDKHGPYALQLASIADELGIILVCLFDHVVHDVEFMEQFSSANVYFPPPNSMFLRGYLRYWMERYQQRYAEYVTVELTEGDYVALASNHTLLAPISAVREWVRSLFYPIVAAVPKDIKQKLFMTTITAPPHMTTTAKGQGDAYILPRDPFQALNTYSQAAGLGLAHAAHRPVKRSEGESNPKEEPEGESNPKEEPEGESNPKREPEEEADGGDSDAKKIRRTDDITEAIQGDYFPLE